MLHFRPMDTGNSPEVKRIAIVGPECTGKTALARFLAEHFQTLWVPEFARSYIETLNRPYQKQDLVIIAKEQVRLENELEKNANRVLICDTTLLVIKIWSDIKYHDCDLEIVESLSKQKYDLQLLTYIDIPWEDDPQREHPHQREQLYERYRSELINTNAQFVEIKGENRVRKATAIQSIQEILK